MRLLPSIGPDHPLCELAWCGGIFSGEGHMRAPTKGYTVRMTIGNTHLPMLERFQKAIGCGSIVGPYNYKGPTCKPHWTWSLSKRADIEDVVHELWPWLTEEKREQATRCLAYKPERAPNLTHRKGYVHKNMHEKTCPHCDQVFMPTLRQQQKYCSAKCQKRARYLREYYGDLERQRAYRREWARAKRARQREA